MADDATQTPTNLGANSITLMTRIVDNNIPLVYKMGAVTSVLDSPITVSQLGVGAREIKIPVIKTSGLKSYSRSNGYANGYFETTLETHTFDYDRGGKFLLDAMDSEEGVVKTFAQLVAEIERTKTTPELDAYRLSKYAQAAKSAGNKAAGSLTDGAGVISALRTASNKMDNDEVDLNNRILFITPALHALVDDMDTNKSKAVLSRFAKVVDTPPSRFVTEIDLLGDGATIETDGGYKKASGAIDINFLILEKSAIMQFTKHVVSKIITPEQNQSSDGYIFFYRCYGLNDTVGEKKSGLYVHTASAWTQ